MAEENKLEQTQDRSQIRKKSDMRTAFPMKGDPNYVDHLTEDPEKENFRFIVMTYISPEGIRGTNTRALKIRDYTKGKDKKKALEAAKKLCEVYRDMDGGKFDTFVMEVGKFCGLRTDQYEDVNYAESELNDLVKGHNDNIEKSKKAHENRISEIKNLQKDDEKTRTIKERLKNKYNNSESNKSKELQADLKNELINNYDKMTPNAENLAQPKQEIESLGCGDDVSASNVEKKHKKKHKHRNKKITPEIQASNNSESVEVIANTSNNENKFKNDEQELKNMEDNLKIDVDTMNKRAEDLNKYYDKIKLVEDQVDEAKKLHKSITGNTVEEPDEVKRIRAVYNKIKNQSC
jgi:hypothetical protein